MTRDDLRKKVDMAFLSAFYSGVLTENQRKITAMHWEEDLSLSEIAEELGISRQSVHETLNRASARLVELESEIHAAERFRKMADGLEQAIALLDQKDYARAGSILEGLMRLDEEDKNGI